MDKNTLSNYGWIVIAVLVLSVMIALATPFGSFIEQGVRSTTEGLFDTSKNAVNTAFEDLGVQMDDQTFEEGYTGVNKTPVKELPAKGKTLEEYTWAEARDIIAAGKAGEYGFAVGGTKTLQINNATHTATIIGLNHDGSNTVTFMVMNNIGSKNLNSTQTNSGGWERCELRDWLNNDIFNSMSNKEQIKVVAKMTNNIGYNGNSVSATQDKVFLLSAKEMNVASSFENLFEGYDYMDAINNEGEVYEWFLNGNVIDAQISMRTMDSRNSTACWRYKKGGGITCYSVNATAKGINYPAFVIG